MTASGAPVGTRDLYSIAVEPGNFDHILVSYHSPWTGTDNAGVLESTDGGLSWTPRNPPAGSAKGYGMAVFFRTEDGGATWAQVKSGLDYSWYMGVAGDGDRIYLAGMGENRPYFVSPETDGQTWTAYDGIRQTFSSQPFEMHFDKVNGILYYATWNGLYALKVAPPGAIKPLDRRATDLRGPRVLTSRGVMVEVPTGERYSLPGRRISPMGP